MPDAMQFCPTACGASKMSVALSLFVSERARFRRTYRREAQVRIGCVVQKHSDGLLVPSIAGDPQCTPSVLVLSMSNTTQVSASSPPSITHPLAQPVALVARRTSIVPEHASGSAPRLNRNLTTSVMPSPAAFINGVMPLVLRQLMSALRSTRNCATSVPPAMQSSVLPNCTIAARLAVFLLVAALHEREREREREKQHRTVSLTSNEAEARSNALTTSKWLPEIA